jgi:hypothetical protein
MIGPAVLVIWFLVVAVFLIRQWWVSELAQAPVGVPASEPVTLPASRPATVGAIVSWSGMHAAGAAAR